MLKLINEIIINSCQLVVAIGEHGGELTRVLGLLICLVVLIAIL